MFLIFLICYKWVRDLTVDGYEKTVDKFGFSSEGYFRIELSPISPKNHPRAFVSLTPTSEDNEINDNNYNCLEEPSNYPGFFYILDFTEDGKNIWEGNITKEDTYQLHIHSCGAKDVKYHSDTLFKNGDSNLDNRLKDSEKVAVAFLVLEAATLIAYCLLLVFIKLKQSQKRMHNLLFVYLTTLILTVISLAFNTAFYYLQIKTESPDAIYIIYSITRGLKLGFLIYIFNLMALGWYLTYEKIQNYIIGSYFAIGAVMAIAIILVAMQTEYQAWPQYVDYIMMAVYWISVIVAFALLAKEIIGSKKATESFPLRRIAFVVILAVLCIVQFVFLALDAFDITHLIVVVFTQLLDFILVLYPLIDIGIFYFKEEIQNKTDPTSKMSIDQIDDGKFDDAEKSSESSS